jgi:hypothetical protein
MKAKQSFAFDLDQGDGQGPGSEGVVGFRHESPSCGSSSTQLALQRKTTPRGVCQQRTRKKWSACSTDRLKWTSPTLSRSFDSSGGSATTARTSDLLIRCAMAASTSWKSLAARMMSQL